MATFELSLKPRLIYIFTIADEAHSDCVKIGETTFNGNGLPEANCKELNNAAHNRIKQYTQTAGISYQLLHTELTLFSREGKIGLFNDKEVHSVLERSGVKKKAFKGATEWYCCDLATAIKAIAAVKQGRKSLKTEDISTTENPIIFRPEQADAIERTEKQFKKGAQMLWNAKMRFGKTLCALQVAKNLQMKRTLIVTHRPVVDAGWYEDFRKIFYDSPNYYYGSKAKGENDFASLEKLANEGGNYVYFASMQDMRGSKEVGGKFDKNNELFSTTWDFLIVDEAHEGTQTELGQSVIAHLRGSNTKILRLSGTPFNLLDDHKEEEIFTWDYVMEQKAKIDWEITHLGDTNPYAALPAIHIYTYDLGRLMSEYSDDEKAFNFREFFRTREDGTFVHDKDIDRFLTLLCDDSESFYPYANDTFRKIFRHTLWILPGVKAAKSLSAKLQNHPIFGAFKVVNVAGDGDEEEESRDALDLVEKAIGKDSDQTYTITLSCGRLTTGVSIKPWTGVFMMAGAYSTSAASYMQTIFRVQTPYTHNGRMKTDCYAFDFAPDRTLRVLAESAKVSAKAGKQTEEDRKILGDFLNFCPIIAIEGSQMKPYDVKTMLGQLKRAQIEKVVQCGFEDGALYNDELLKLTEVELKDFSNLRATIGKTKAMPRPGDIDINKQGLNNELHAEKERLEKKKKKDLTTEEAERLEQLKALGDQRREAIAILRGISIRMPLLLYGAEITNEDEELTLDNFEKLVDDTSWEEFMPRGVTKEVFRRFKRYYDSDIFREAGKRIREMARMADKFTIEERISRIAAIFATFRNPDKETVLTPWRVVNRHLSDCLGGYCFMDKNFEQPLDVPRYVTQEGVTEEVFTPKNVILEINSKSGLYPLYAAYNIYRSRIEEAKKKYREEVGRQLALQLWDATLEENILVVCKTPMARSITKRTLAGFRETTVRAEYYPELIENISKQPESVVNMLHDGKRFWHFNDKEYMKIDTIIGNPPYQVMDGGAQASAKPIYQLFIQQAMKLNPKYISMITPSRWFAGGKGLDDFRKAMLKDKRIKAIHDYPNASEIFPSIEIKGGVNYFLWDKEYKGDCLIRTYENGVCVSALKRPLKENNADVFIRYNEAIPILRKIQSFNEKSFSELMSSAKPFGLRTYFKGESEPFEGAIKIYVNGGVGYIKKEEVLKNQHWIKEHKVIVPYAIGSGDSKTDKVNPIYAEPNSCCTETYLVIGPFATKKQCENVMQYIGTKFLHFCLTLKKNTQHSTKEFYQFVPQQNFDEEWTDEKLYKKYGLTPEEIVYIEKMIRPME
ncbi:Eco57I restriction-modification methylase domain-containing protein [Capnocytophaga bilenii]|uniref:Eco57I restriction-modification methylase domain-containing protein n=1 Tax=Capnocytophaga bilenii TaxID=2819369 RepID=UPI001F2F774F|nr:Eco57I restriction-modification methylase domain-containing protein [Capnocytophaga bilenii]